MLIAKSFSRQIEAFASKMIDGAGTTYTLVIVFILVMIWIVSGIFLDFSQNWQAIISTASSVITILMVFLIQKSQNKHSISIQLKLNELVAANEKASNRLVNVEGMTEDELKVIQKYYLRLSDFVINQESLQQSHSIDEVHNAHAIKKEMEEELKEIKKEKD